MLHFIKKSFSRFFENFTKPQEKISPYQQAAEWETKTPSHQRVEDREIFLDGIRSLHWHAKAHPSGLTAQTLKDKKALIQAYEGWAPYGSRKIIRYRISGEEADNINLKILQRW